MLKEFAVDPALLADWKDCRYLIEKFGFHHGRVISTFPNKWTKRVINAALQHSDGIQNKKRVEELLAAPLTNSYEKAKKRMIPNERVYPDSEPDNWLESAEAAHAAKPFQAIIAKKNFRSHPEVIEFDSLNEEHPLFDCPHECFMPRDPDGFKKIAGPLLKWAREKIIFVDPILGNHPQNPRWRASLEAMLGCVSPAPPLELRYCTSIEDASDPGILNSNIILTLQDNLSGSIPHGLRIEVVILETNLNLDTHNRYILTERGGIKFPWGLDTGWPRARDTVNLMAVETHKEKLAEYSEPGKFGYNVVASFTLTGTATP